jgi:hypothetical protein
MKPKTLILLPGAILLLVLIAAVVGVFYQTSGNHIAYLTVRGEHATYQGSGLYFYDPASVAGEGILWDVINLVLALPLFVVAIVLSWHNSLRGRLLQAGMLFYFFYQYMQYAVMLAFNPLFLVYVTIFALSAVAFFLNMQSIDVSRLSEHLSVRFPHRLIIGFTLVMSAALTLLWVGGRIIPYTIAGRFPDELAGMTTLQTQAFDLGLVVPLLISTAVLLGRRSPWGYFIAAISCTFGFIMCITIPVWIAVPMIQAGQMNLIEAVPFTLLCLIGLYVSGRYFWSIHEDKKPRSHSEIAAI